MTKTQFTPKQAEQIIQKIIELDNSISNQSKEIANFPGDLIASIQSARQLLETYTDSKIYNRYENQIVDSNQTALENSYYIYDSYEYRLALLEKMLNQSSPLNDLFESI